MLKSVIKKSNSMYNYALEFSENPAIKPIGGENSTVGKGSEFMLIIPAQE